MNKCCICGGGPTVLLVTRGLAAIGHVLYCEGCAAEVLVRAQRRAASRWN